MVTMRGPPTDPPARDYLRTHASGDCFRRSGIARPRLIFEPRTVADTVELGIGDDSCARPCSLCE
jgi:hypothetical protein